MNTEWTFFLNKLKNATTDCENFGTCELTKLWGKSLRALCENAYLIGLYESGDINFEDSFNLQLKYLEDVRKELNKVETLLRWHIQGLKNGFKNK